LLNVDKETSQVFCPTLKSEVDSFVENVLGRKLDGGVVDSGGGDTTNPADLILLDQNIELDNHGVSDLVIFTLFTTLTSLCVVFMFLQVVFGTDLAELLRGQGFKGLVLIRSANAADADFVEYLRSGAVDGCLSKDGSNRDVASSVRREYLKKFNMNRSRDWSTEDNSPTLVSAQLEPRPTRVLVVPVEKGPPEPYDPPPEPANPVHIGRPDHEALPAVLQPSELRRRTVLS
jgi:hypothetical protein